MREIGVKSYESSLLSNFMSVSQKMLIESYFDMNVANAVSIVGIHRHKNEFKQFFTGPSNILNSCLVVIYCLLLSLFGIYYHVRIHFNQHMFEKNTKVKE